MSFLRAALLFLAVLPGAAFAAELGPARISLIEGDVQIYTADTQDWVAASINMPLREGDRLWVPEDARTEVQIQGGVYIRLGAASAFDILALQEESYQFYLNGGHAYINNRKGGIDHIQVDTPQSSVGCYDNSLVMIDVAENGATDVAVLKGYAAAETSSGKTRVEAGDELHVGGDLTAEISPLAPPDEWENWNRERDKMLVAGNRSLRYIPEELDDYAYELDDYGKWVYVTDYGYCWTPLTVSAGWAPYRDGRWVWINGDYVWIASEPWGWAPHHYGRWAFVVGFGWCWVPPRAGGIYWSPGYVGWVHTPTSVAWVPLAPGEIFYGRGYYGPASVNITNVTINQTVVRNYRNVSVSNAVTVVSNTTFISGRKEPARVRANPFREANVNVGQPVIKPTRELARPVDRNIPSARKPPERVRQISVDQIKRERGVVREEKGSVFKPGRPGAEMPVKKRDEPQSAIRQQHPPVPEAKPAQKSPFAPRGEQPPARAPETTRERQTPQPAQPTQPTQPTHRGERQPPAKQPEIIKGGPTLPSAKPEPRRERPESAAPGQSTPQPRGGPPAKMQREPRWQEPTPTREPEVQRQGAPLQPGSRKAAPRTETPQQPGAQQSAPRKEAPAEQHSPQAPPPAGKKRPAPTPREPADGSERPRERVPMKQQPE
ncbi:MAG TPA: DUF6600 domain-containing protein [Geobacteraceae bacterium]